MASALAAHGGRNGTVRGDGDSAANCDAGCWLADVVRHAAGRCGPHDDAAAGPGRQYGAAGCQLFVPGARWCERWPISAAACAARIRGCDAALRLRRRAAVAATN